MGVSIHTSHSLNNVHIKTLTLRNNTKSTPLVTIKYVGVQSLLELHMPSTLLSFFWQEHPQNVELCLFCWSVTSWSHTLQAIDAETTNIENHFVVVCISTEEG